MPISSRVLAPAKLNLFLHITGRRADGYHELQTVFQFIDLYDELTFSPRPDGKILRRYSLADVPEDKDLCLNAARLLQQATGTTVGVEIDMQKRIPMGAGLGGGSSDAAAVLVGLNRMWGTGLAQTQLQQLGLRLGADVPVFVYGRACWAEGVGERFVALDQLYEPWYLVIVPHVHVSTREVFNTQELTRNSVPIRIRDFLQGSARNDCEAVVYRKYPEIRHAADWLASFGVTRMSGTGAAVFCAFEQESDAEQALKQKPERWRGYVVKGLNCSPLASVGVK